MHATYYNYVTLIMCGFVGGNNSMNHTCLSQSIINFVSFFITSYFTITMCDLSAEKHVLLQCISINIMLSSF